MKHLKNALVILSYFFAQMLCAQDISGYWQGVVLQPDCTGSGLGTDIFPVQVNLVQSGGIIDGTIHFQKVGSPNYATFQFNNSTFDGSTWHLETDYPFDANPFDIWCVDHESDMAYNQIQEILSGTWTADAQPAAYGYTSFCCPGTLELYRTEILSPTVYCPGESFTLEVTGQNINWYADAGLSNYLGSGNTISGSLTSSDTYYVTQTHYNVESPPVPVEVTIGAPSITSTIEIDATCGQNNGQASIGATSALGALEFAIDNEPFQNSATFIGLAAGTYQITVRDATGCTTSTPIVIGQAAGPSISALNANQTDCASSIGSIIVDATDGTPPYEYALDNGAFQSNNSFFNLSAGTYQITVRDANGCPVMDTATVGQPSPPTISAINSSNASCGLMNGSISIDVTGGSSPYEYSLDGGPFQSSNSFANLTGGNYAVQVRDLNSCTVNDSAIVTEESGPSISAINEVDPSCNGGDGSISIVANGTAPFSYSLDGVTFQNSNQFDNLNAGSFTVFIEDANGCSDDDTVNLQSSSAPTVNGVTTSPAQCGFDDGQITIDAVGGTGTLEYSLDNISFQSSNTFSGLAVGTYTVYVNDANMCLATDQGIIENPNSPEINVINVVNASCAASDGSINVEGISGAPPYSYSIDGINFLASGLFENLARGDYLIFITDANNCENNEMVEVMGSIGPHISDSQITHTSCGEENGAITVMASGTTSLQYSINGTDFQTSNIFENLAAATYTVTVKDQDNCPDQVSETVEASNTSDSGCGPIVVEPPTPVNPPSGPTGGPIGPTEAAFDLKIPSAFSPNNDGVNDSFRIFVNPNTNGLVRQFEVYNRWGKLIYTSQGSLIEMFEWKGTETGEEVLTGVYTFLIELEYDDGTSASKYGNVTVLK